MAQTDAFVEWFAAQVKIENRYNFDRRRDYVHKLDCLKNASSAADEDHFVHTSKNMKPEGGLSEKAVRNVARYYRQDYELLKELQRHACKSTDCEQGIQSILDRRAEVLASLE